MFVSDLLQIFCCTRTFIKPKIKITFLEYPSLLIMSSIKIS